MRFTTEWCEAPIFLPRPLVVVYRCAAPIELLWFLGGNGFTNLPPEEERGESVPCEPGALV